MYGKKEFQVILDLQLRGRAGAEKINRLHNIAGICSKLKHYPTIMIHYIFNL